jgi:Domain of unknown function (DUF4136)
MSLSVSKAARYRLLVLAVVLGVAGCETGPAIRSNVDPSAQFSRYKTFDFLEPSESGKPGYQSFGAQYLVSAITRELEARGFQRHENPDLLVNYHVQKQDKVQVTDTGYSGYYGYRGGYYGWGAGINTSTYVDTYTEGTLNIDVVEAADHKLLWEGIAVGRISERAQNNLQPTIDAVVKQVFQRFPVPPPAPAAAQPGAGTSQ